MSQEPPLERASDGVNRPLPRLLLRLIPHVGDKLVTFLDEIEEQRSRRIQQWLAELSRLTDLTVDEILDRALSSEVLTETVAATFTAAAVSPHPENRAALARALAQALNDDASIDQARFLTRTIAALEPVHVRVLAVLAQNRTEPYDDSERKQGEFVASAWPERLIAQRLHSEHGVVEMILLHLQAQGLTITEGLAWDDRSRPWHITTPGRLVLSQLSPLDDLGARPDEVPEHDGFSATHHYPGLRPMDRQFRPPILNVSPFDQSRDIGARE